jgi:hypothetical protein
MDTIAPDTLSPAVPKPDHVPVEAVYDFGMYLDPGLLRDPQVESMSQWTAPFNATSAVTWVAQYAMRHVKKYGMKHEQLAQIALTDRANAMLNPRALVREPLSLGTVHGGAGRLHGFGFAHEAMVQLRGQGGERQIKGNPEAAWRPRAAGRWLLPSC